MGQHSDPNYPATVELQAITQAQIAAATAQLEQADAATGPVDVAPAPRPRTKAVDGGRGGLLARTEPKVKAASAVAFLATLAVGLVHHFLPLVDSLPVEAQLSADGLVVGAVTWLAGWCAKAADRVDLFE